MSRNRTRAAQFIGNLTVVGSHAIARQELGPNAMGCDYCFPHGRDCVNQNRDKHVEKHAWERRRDISRKYARIRKEQQAELYRAYVADLTAAQDWMDDAQDWMDEYLSADDRWLDLNPEFETFYSEAQWEEIDRRELYPEAYKNTCYNPFTLMTREEAYPEAFSDRLNQIMLYREGQPVYRFQRDDWDVPSYYEQKRDTEESAVLEVICIKGVEIEV